MSVSIRDEDVLPHEKVDEKVLSNWLLYAIHREKYIICWMLPCMLMLGVVARIRMEKYHQVIFCGVIDGGIQFTVVIVLWLNLYSTRESKFTLSTI